MDDQPALLVEHRYRCPDAPDELRLALYRLRRTHAVWQEVRVTLLEHSRELGSEFTATVATVEQARPVGRPGAAAAGDGVSAGAIDWRQKLS